jgi:hypothetical protein
MLPAVGADGYQFVAAEAVHAAIPAGYRSGAEPGLAAVGALRAELDGRICHRAELNGGHGDPAIATLSDPGAGGR